LVDVVVVGASGYTGGELLRLLFQRSDVNVVQVTSRRFLGQPVSILHPNLRGVADMRFEDDGSLRECDVLFTCLPHGKSMDRMKEFLGHAQHVIDLSADFRLSSSEDYVRWYGREHPAPDLLPRFPYGLPELHREEVREKGNAAAPGCIASSIVLALYPVRHLVDRVVCDAKIGSSAAGNSPGESTHHPERSGVIRPYAPVRHRHQAEVEQELGLDVMLTAHAVEMVRGISTTSHVLLKEDVAEKELWRLYREAYGSEPFMRIVKSRKGLFRYPEPKIVVGSNYCDVGFELDPDHRRLVVFSALDNLVKGAAGSAVQCMNVIMGMEETAGLEFTGLHPV